MASRVQLQGGGFRDGEGNPLANGYLTFDLPTTGVQTDGIFITQQTVKIPLDANGDVVTSPLQYIWGNDNLLPDGTYYRVTAYSADGQPVWGPNNQRVVGSETFDLGTWIPNSVENVITPSDSPTVVTATQVFVDASGSPIADGRLELRLSRDAVSDDGKQIDAKRTVVIPLDGDGGATFFIYPNSALTDDTLTKTTFYFATVYSAGGQPVWKQQIVLASDGTSFLVQDSGDLILLDDNSGAFLLDN
jgi:hypothetical protein